MLKRIENVSENIGNSKNKSCLKYGKISRSFTQSFIAIDKLEWYN
jgi:hypothetical protein